MTREKHCACYIYLDTSSFIKWACFALHIYLCVLHLTPSIFQTTMITHATMLLVATFTTLLVTSAAQSTFAPAVVSSMRLLQTPFHSARYVKIGRYQSTLGGLINMVEVRIFNVKSHQGNFFAEVWRVAYLLATFHIQLSIGGSLRYQQRQPCNRFVCGGSGKSKQWLFPNRK